MKERVEKAVSNYNNGYSCAQAILSAYKDVINLSETDAYRFGEAFGKGVAGMQDTCGAVNALYMVLSYIFSDGEPGSKKSRKDTYKIINEATEKFKARYGSIMCRDIIFNQAGVSCVQKVFDAADILEEILEENGKLKAES